MTAEHRARVDSGWFLVGQIVLAVLAALSPALGAREGVSSVLPPLRAEAVGPVTEATACRREDDSIPVAGRRRGGAAAVVACVVALVEAARRARTVAHGPPRRHAPRTRTAWSRPPGRAPPLPS